VIEKQPFRKYNTDDKAAPMPVKLNKKDELMLKVGMYALNMGSKSGVLKFLAHRGLKVLLRDFSMDSLHYLTRGDRIRVIQERPEMGGIFDDLEKR